MPSKLIQSAILTITLFQHAFGGVRVFTNAIYSGVVTGEVTVDELYICENAIQIKFLNSTAFISKKISDYEYNCQFLHIVGHTKDAAKGQQGNTIHVRHRNKSCSPKDGSCCNHEQYVPVADKDPTCQASSDILFNVRSSEGNYAHVFKVDSQESCHTACTKEQNCKGAVFYPWVEACQMKASYFKLTRLDGANLLKNRRFV
ncbi:hypothetical protein ABG067_005249 [Albugo candida]